MYLDFDDIMDLAGYGPTPMAYWLRLSRQATGLYQSGDALAHCPIIAGRVWDSATRARFVP